MSDFDRDDERERGHRYALRNGYGGTSERASGTPGKQASAAALPAGSNGPYRGSVFGGGAALPAQLQRQFESSLGVDLSGVRVHTGTESSRSASSVSARAYAIGQDVHFGSGQYDPTTTRGQQLIAHEVAHTVQQRGTGARAQFKLEVTAAGDACEVEADAAADAMMAGRPFSVQSSGLAIARQDHASTAIDDTIGGRASMQRHIAGLATIAAVQEQLELLHAAEASAPSVAARIFVHYHAGGSDGVHLAAGDLAALSHACDERMLQLVVQLGGPQFASLADRLPASSVVQLNQLAARYRAGAPAMLEAIGADIQTLHRLLSTLTPPMDPLAAESLRQLGQAMNAAFLAAQDEQRPAYRQDDGTGETLEEHDERIRGYFEAGQQIREGLFAGICFQIEYARSGNFDRATHAAHVGAAIDGLVQAGGLTVEARHAASEAPPRDASGHVEEGPTVVGIDGQEPPPRAEPVDGPRITDMTAPRGETRAERRARERTTMARHADRFRRTRR